MKTRFFMLLAAVLLSSASVFAQSNTMIQKGDINGDGSIDISDVVALVNYILNGESTVRVTEISLDKTTLEIPANGTGEITATISPSNASNMTVNWESSDPSVATVSASTTSGNAATVTWINEGNATITATAAGDTSKSASCNVTCKLEEETPTYYWYVGQTQPTSQSSVTEVTGATPGWHEIGQEIGTYTFNAPLYNSESNPITSNPSQKAEWYVALPVGSSLGIYDSDDVNEVNVGNWTTLSPITVANVTYNVYKSVGTYRNFNGWWIH